MNFVIIYIQKMLGLRVGLQVSNSCSVFWQRITDRLNEIIVKLTFQILLFTRCINSWWLWCCTDGLRVNVAPKIHGRQSTKSTAECPFKLYFSRRIRYNYYQLSFNCPHGVSSLTSCSLWAAMLWLSIENSYFDCASFPPPTHINPLGKKSQGVFTLLPQVR